VLEGPEFHLFANPIVPIDLVGTTELAVIFAYGSLRCLEDSWLYRLNMGAPIDIYAAEDEDGYLSKNGYELVPFRGTGPPRYN
jgi:hypothetical protein